MLTLPPCEFGFGGRKFTEPRLPFGFQGAGHKTVLRLYGPITTFCPFGLVAGSFDLQAPLGNGGFMIRFDIFFGDEVRLRCRQERRRRERHGQPLHRFVIRQRADKTFLCR